MILDQKPIRGSDGIHCGLGCPFWFAGVEPGEADNCRRHLVALTYRAGEVIPLLCPACTIEMLNANGVL